MDCYLFRVDGSNTIGLGHVMRCLSFGRVVSRKGIRPVYLTRSGDSVPNMIEESGFDAEVLTADCSVREELKYVRLMKEKYQTNILITDINNGQTFRHPDEYHDYLNGIRSLCKSASFETFTPSPFPSNMVIMPYVGAEKLNIKKHPGTRYLLGAKYAVLADIFLPVKPIKINRSATRILITMGGSDPSGLTMMVVKALFSIRNKFMLTVILGRCSLLSKKDLSDRFGLYSDRLSIIEHTDNMASVMSSADIAVISSGLTKYETAAMGLPSLAISIDADHDRAMENFAEYGSMQYLGVDHELRSHDITDAVMRLADDYLKRKEMARSGTSLLDGNGTERIADELKDMVD